MCYYLLANGSFLPACLPVCLSTWGKTDIQSPYLIPSYGHKKLEEERARKGIRKRWKLQQGKSISGTLSLSSRPRAHTESPKVTFDSLVHHSLHSCSGKQLAAGKTYLGRNSFSSARKHNLLGTRGVLGASYKWILLQMDFCYKWILLFFNQYFSIYQDCHAVYQ